MIPYIFQDVLIYKKPYPNAHRRLARHFQYEVPFSPLRTHIWIHSRITQFRGHIVCILYLFAQFPTRFSYDRRLYLAKCFGGPAAHVVVLSVGRAPDLLMGLVRHDGFILWLSPNLISNSRLWFLAKIKSFLYHTLSERY